MSGERVKVRETEDGELLRAALGGDQSAWDEIVTRHAQLVWEIARSHHLDVVTSAEVCALTWLQCVDHLDELVGIGHVDQWLAQTAGHEAGRVASSLQPTPSVVSGVISAWQDIRTGAGTRSAF